MRKAFACLCVVFLLLTAPGLVNAAGQEDPLAPWRAALQKAPEDAARNPPVKPTAVYEPEEEPDPAYLKAIERAEQGRVIEKSIESSKTPVPVQGKKVDSKEKAERVCLAGQFCMNADFSDAPDASKFVYKCEQFNREYPNPPSRELSREAHTCFSFLLGFGQALSLESYIHHGADKKIRPLCIGGAAEEMPRKYLNFMKDNPDLLTKYFSYGVFRFFEETFPCIDKE